MVQLAGLILHLHHQVRFQPEGDVAGDGVLPGREPDQHEAHVVGARLPGLVVHQGDCLSYNSTSRATTRRLSGGQDRDDTG